MSSTGVDLLWQKAFANAANYRSCSYGFMETLIREKTVPSMVLGKRRVIDIRDLDDYIDQIKGQTSE
jgi:hypothetical protein